MAFNVQDNFQSLLTSLYRKNAEGKILSYGVRSLGNKAISLYVQFSEDKPVSQGLHGLSRQAHSSSMASAPARSGQNMGTSFIRSQSADRCGQAALKRMYGVRALSATAPNRRSESVSLPSGKHPSPNGQRDDSKDIIYVRTDTNGGHPHEGKKYRKTAPSGVTSTPHSASSGTGSNPLDGEEKLCQSAASAVISTNDVAQASTDTSVSSISTVPLEPQPATSAVISTNDVAPSSMDTSASSTSTVPLEHALEALVKEMASEPADNSRSSKLGTICHDLNEILGGACAPGPNDAGNRQVLPL